MTTGRPPWRLTRQSPCKQSVRISARGLEPGSGGGRLHGQVPLDTIFRDVLTGQRTSDLKKADGNGESLGTPKTQETPDPETPDEPGSPDKLAATQDKLAATPDEPAAKNEPEAPKARRGFSRRQALTVLGIG